jgi:hypothetical protein
MSTASLPLSTGRSYWKATLVNGQPARVRCIDIAGQTYAINRGPVTVVGLEDDWYEDVRDPEHVIEALRSAVDFRADIFTFWQRPPDVDAKYTYSCEWEQIALLPTPSYENWWTHQIKSRVRNQIRKSEKQGLTVRETVYDDEFVRGMTAIFNESSVRQGRKFWHYGKDFETVKRQFSRFVHREVMIGAYFQGEMIGLMMLGVAGHFGLTGQIISSLRHRDKSPNNALIAKAVELCAERNLDYLCYLFWSDDSLAEFKRRCGFQKIEVPRYFVPLTANGHLALRLGAHRGWKRMIPEQIKAPLKRLRRRWYGTLEN